MRRPLAIYVLLFSLPLLQRMGGAGQLTPVPPEGVSPYDPKPLMAKLEERIRTDTYTFAVLGDTKHAKAFPALLKYLDETIAPDFVLTTGDMVQGGGGNIGPDFWEKLSLDSGDDFRKRPWWPAIGNHEIAGTPITLKAELDDDEVLKTNQKSGIENFKKFYNLEREYYSFAFRNAVFIALPWRYPEKESEKWLEEELRKAQAAGKLIFVFNHCPFYTVGIKLKKDITNKETSITKLFDKYGVLAVFSGHDHGYYRTVRNGIPYFISAGGGATIYPATRKNEALPEDVWYFLDPQSLKSRMDPATGERVTKKRYILHDGAERKADRVTEAPDQFTVVVKVEGKSVTLQCITAKGEKLDEMVLAK